MIFRPYQFDLMPRMPETLQSLPNNICCKWIDC